MVFLLLDHCLAYVIDSDSTFDAADLDVIFETLGSAAVQALDGIMLDDLHAVVRASNRLAEALSVFPSS